MKIKLEKKKDKILNYSFICRVAPFENNCMLFVKMDVVKGGLTIIFLIPQRDSKF